MQLRGVGTNGKSGKFLYCSCNSRLMKGSNGFVMPLQ